MSKEKHHCLHLTKQTKSCLHSTVLWYTYWVSFSSFLCHWVWIVECHLVGEKSLWCHSQIALSVNFKNLHSNRTKGICVLILKISKWDKCVTTETCYKQFYENNIFFESFFQISKLLFVCILFHWCKIFTHDRFL